MGKICAEVLSPVLSTARDRRLRAVLKTKSRVFSHTDRPSLVNNMFISVLR